MKRELTRVARCNLYIRLFDHRSAPLHAVTFAFCLPLTAQVPHSGNPCVRSAARTSAHHGRPPSQLPLNINSSGGQHCCWYARRGALPLTGMTSGRLQVHFKRPMRTPYPAEYVCSFTDESYPALAFHEILNRRTGFLLSVIRLHRGIFIANHISHSIVCAHRTDGCPS